MNVPVKVSKPLNIPSAKRHPADSFNQEVIKDPDLSLDPENFRYLNSSLSPSGTLIRTYIDTAKITASLAKSWSVKLSPQPLDSGAPPITQFMQSLSKVGVRTLPWQTPVFTVSQHLHITHSTKVKAGHDVQYLLDSRCLIGNPIWGKQVITDPVKGDSRHHKWLLWCLFHKWKKDRQ